jgi:predicted transcriptional regulator
MKEKMTETISIKLGKTMKEELRALAESDRRTLSSYIAIVLEDFLAQRRAGKADVGKKPPARKKGDS